MLNCLQEKLQKEVRTDSQPVQLHNMGKGHLEQIVSDRLQDNATSVPTASLGRQEQQNDPPNVQTGTHKEREDELIDSGLEFQSEIILLCISFISQSCIVEFNPTELVKKKEGTFSALAVIVDYLEKRMKWCLTKSEHEALIKDHPKPDLLLCKVPAVAKFMKVFLGKQRSRQQPYYQSSH